MKEFFSKLIMNIGIPYKREIHCGELEQFRKVNYQGYGLLCHTPWRLSNLFIRGKYKYIALITGPDHCVGTGPDGIQKIELKKVLEKCDRYIIISSMSAEMEDRRKVASYGLRLVGHLEHIKTSISISDMALYNAEAFAHCFDFVTGFKNFCTSYETPIAILEDRKNWIIVDGFGN